MKTVFVLGAGFSAAARIPLVEGFLPEARLLLNRGEVDNKHAGYYHSVFRHTGQLERAAKWVNHNFHNLEDVFGLIEIAHTLGDQGGRHDLSTSACFRAVVKHLIELKQDELFAEEGNPWSLYARFIEHYIAAHYREVAVITFNYDEVLERTCIEYFARAGRSIGVKFRSRFEDGRREDDANGNVDLLKLHGSVSWLKGDRTPHIIPPTWNKSLTPDDSVVFVPIWKRASEWLTHAERIVFIGYSFPISDQYFRQLLAFSLAQSVKLQDVLVIDPEERVSEHAKALFNVHFQRCFKFFPIKMETLDLGSKPATNARGEHVASCRALLQQR